MAELIPQNSGIISWGLRDPTGIEPDFFNFLIAAAVAEEMMMRKNLLKEKLRRGEVASGVLIQDPIPQMVEVLALLGFDWLFIDCEHSSLSLSDVGQLVIAAEARDMTPLVRVPQNFPQVILPYLDAGALGIIIPGAENVDCCVAAVRGAKYAPEGVRGLAPARSADYGLRGPLGNTSRQRTVKPWFWRLWKVARAWRTLKESSGPKGLMAW